ncbi:MAG: precorrin-3B C(17)-methyltransferase [Lachnospiraceae bacterium]|nr:precorrin-3B C(17)-methyltransferase [Lachnospiraceae bacterium]
MKKLYIVGIGPGAENMMTMEARCVLEAADVICGYTVYVDLIKKQYPDKEFFTTPMRRELERCRMALTSANDDKTTAMVCSGDAGIYGMAGPILEMQEQFPEVDVEIVPGITAAISGAAILGAPLMNDFCVISLSDQLTPWDVIERRLRAAAAGDFAICLYNPMSRKRPDHLAQAARILLEQMNPLTVCGWVRNIGREDTEKKLLTLEELMEEKVDMFTTVFIGNSHTRNLFGRMVTGRGYEI